LSSISASPFRTTAIIGWKDDSLESTWNDLTGIKLMLRDSHVDESRVLLICLFFVWPASHFTLFNNQVLIPAKEHAVLNELALLQYKGTT